MEQIRLYLKGAAYKEDITGAVCAIEGTLEEHNFIISCHLYLYRPKDLPDWFVWMLMGAGLVFIRPIKRSLRPFIISCILNAGGVTAHLQGEELENGQLMKWKELAAKAI